MSTISALVAFSSSTIAFAKDHSFLAPDGISLKAANNGGTKLSSNHIAEELGAIIPPMLTATNPVQAVIRDLLANTNGLREDLQSGVANRVEALAKWAGSTIIKGKFGADPYSYPACSSGATSLSVLLNEKALPLRTVAEVMLDPETLIKKTIGVLYPQAHFKKLSKFLGDKKDGFVTVQLVIKEAEAVMPFGHAFVLIKSEGEVHMYQTWVGIPKIRYSFPYKNGDAFLAPFKEFLNLLVQEQKETEKVVDFPTSMLRKVHEKLFETKFFSSLMPTYEVRLEVGVPQTYDMEVVNAVLTVGKSALETKKVTK